MLGDIKTSCHNNDTPNTIDPDNMPSILAFDIQTIPDIAGLRLLHKFPDSISDEDVGEWAMQKQRAKTARNSMPYHLQKIVAISCCLRWGSDRVHVNTIGDIDDDEEAIIAKFFDLLERYTPQLVSWEGISKSLPILHYRAMVHGISAARYWDNGLGDFDDSHEFIQNNYHQRQHSRHCDLKDTLSGMQQQASVPFDDLSKLCGFPGKLSLQMQEDQVWPAYQQNGLQDIRDNCEVIAAKTYLLFLRFELMRGFLDADNYQADVKRLHDYLKHQDAPHWLDFCSQWQQRG